MSAYPSHAIELTSSVEIESGIADDFAQSGSQHSRIFHSQAYYRFTLNHTLSLSQFNALHATYQAGPRDVYTLTYFDESPQATYSVKFISPPKITANLGLNRCGVVVQLRGTKD